MDNLLDNPRGYVFVSLSRSYERMHRWGWFAAMRKGGMAPTKSEFVGVGLDLFDRAAPDDVRAWTDETVRFLSGSIRANSSGRLRYKRNGSGFDVSVKWEPVDFGLPEWRSMGQVEDGYRRVEERDRLRSMLNLLSERLSPRQLECLSVYVDALPDTLTYAEVAEVMGVSPQAVDSYWRKIRKHAAAVVV